LIFVTAGPLLGAHRTAPPVSFALCANEASATTKRSAGTESATRCGWWD